MQPDYPRLFVTGTYLLYIVPIHSTTKYILYVLVGSRYCTVVYTSMYDGEITP